MVDINLARTNTSKQKLTKYLMSHSRPPSVRVNSFVVNGGCTIRGAATLWVKKWSPYYNKIFITVICIVSGLNQGSQNKCQQKTKCLYIKQRRICINCEKNDLMEHKYASKKIEVNILIK